MTPRGIRNNNPGNIRISGDDWLGLSPTQPDPEFFTFSDPVYGLRAMAKILLKYQRKYGLKTVAQMISRWAPPGENDTESYVLAVAKAIGVDPDQPIDLTTAPAHFADVIDAIVFHENGQNPYNDGVVMRAVRMVLAN